MELERRRDNSLVFEALSRSWDRYTYMDGAISQGLPLGDRTRRAKHDLMAINWFVGLDERYATTTVYLGWVYDGIRKPRVWLGRKEDTGVAKKSDGIFLLCDGIPTRHYDGFC